MRIDIDEKYPTLETCLDCAKYYRGNLTRNKKGDYFCKFIGRKIWYYIPRDESFISSFIDTDFMKCKRWPIQEFSL